MSGKIANRFFAVVAIASALGLAGCASTQHNHVQAAAPAPVPQVPAPAAPTHVNPPKVVPPSLVSNVPSVGQDSNIVLSLTIKADGTVGAVGVVETSGYPDLDTAAAESVKKFKYAPATANGRPIDYVLHQTVTYKVIQ